MRKVCLSSLGAIAGAAERVEHYEIASYRGLITAASLMGQQDIVSLLQQNLQQGLNQAFEGTADRHRHGRLGAAG